MKKLCYSIIVACSLWASGAHATQTIREYVNQVVEECSELVVQGEKKFDMNRYQSQAIFFKCISLEFEEYSLKLIEANKAQKKGEYHL